LAGDLLINIIQIKNYGGSKMLFTKKTELKQFGRLFGILLLILLLSISCSKTEQKKEITVALFQAPASESLIKLIPEFEKETGIKINCEILPYAELKAKVEQQFFAKSGNYDVIMADCIWIPSFAERNFLGKVDIGVWKNGNYEFDDLLPALDDYLGHYPKGGERFGMPFMSNTHMMSYRSSIVKPVVESLNMNLPGESPETAWTWEEYLKVAKAISEKELMKGDEKIYGTSLQARAGAWLVYEWYSELFGFVQNETARITGLPAFNENAASAMQYYADLYKYAPKEALTWGHEEETSAICSGKCAMDATSNVELAAYLLKSTCGESGAISFAYPPKGPSGKASPDMGGYGLLLSNFSKNPKESSHFILWAASKKVHKRIVLEGGSPIRRSEIADKEVLEKYPYLKFYDLLIRDSVYRARIPKWPELQDIISREVTAVMKNEKKAEDATQVVHEWVNKNIDTN
jgi:multiple sugar transport system substrate-binding protein